MTACYAWPVTVGAGADLRLHVSTEHERFESKQLSSSGDFDFCIPPHAASVEDDRLLRQPCKFRGVAYFQPSLYQCGLVQGSVDSLGGL